MVTDCRLTVTWQIVALVLAIGAPRVIVDIAQAKDVLNGKDEP